MTTIHMQTETVHSTARQMEQNASQAEAQLGSLLRALQELEATWRGGSSDEFAGEAQELIRQLKVQNDLLAVLARRVEREANEWEEVDRRGTSGMRNPVSAGATSPSGGIANVVSKLSWSVLALPLWLTTWLDRLFPSEPVISPIPDEQPAPPVNDIAPPPKQTKFGDLLEQAEREKQAKEQALQQTQAQLPEKKQPLPEHMVDYPTRPDDGTFLAGQEEDDSCAIASTRMALNRVGVDVKESDLRDTSHKMDGGYQHDTKWGTNPTSLDDLVNTNYSDKASATYNGSGQTLNDLDTAAERGDGIVVTVKNSEWFGEANAHSVTVVDVVKEDGKQMILVNDPWPPKQGKRISVPASEFQEAWYGDALYVSKKAKE